MFSTHGIPKTVVSDNVPFCGYSFAKFANEWSFEIITSSPHYPKSNGLAKKAVGIAKNIFTKTGEEGVDIRAALLRVQKYANIRVKCVTSRNADVQIVAYCITYCEN